MREDDATDWSLVRSALVEGVRRRRSCIGTRGRSVQCALNFQEREAGGCLDEGWKWVRS
jgi:hypothetical protein